MASNAADFTKYKGLFRDRFAPKIIQSFGANDTIQAKVKIGDFETLGNEYKIPVVLSEEGGATYAASPQSGAFALEATVEGKIDFLTIRGFNHAFRSNLGYEAVAASLRSEMAADTATGTVANSLRRNARRRIELDGISGQVGLGVVESVNPAGSPSNTIQITEATWAPARWIGLNGHRFEIFDTTLATRRVDTGVSTYKITKINISKRWITFDTALAGGGGGSAVVATDKVFFKGQVVAGGPPTHNSQRGIHDQLGNSGTHYGLDAATYEVMAGNVLDCGGARLNFELAEEAASRIQDMGNDDLEMNLLVSPLTQSRLISDLAADRRFDGSYTKEKGELGNRQVIYAAPNGDIRIMAHPLVQRGFAYMFAWDNVARPGTYDLSFTRPVGRNDARIPTDESILMELPDDAGFQIRLYHNSVFAVKVPSHTVRFESINNA